MTTATKKIKIPVHLTVKELALLLELPIAEVVSELIKNKIYLTANETIDNETALLLAEDLGFKAELASTPKEVASDAKTESVTANPKNLKSRPAVVTFLGHVDHGKTSLIDKIRETNIAEGEAGKITQHINIYEIKSKNLTIIDTPGHEAFASLRQRGTSLTDIAVLVVATDEGLKPQTKESVKLVKAAGLPIIVALNKIDKPEANPDKVKKDLAEIEVNPEEWGGDTPFIETSAQTGDGLDTLVDTIATRVKKLSLVADPKADLVATVLESRTDPKTGTRSTVLVQSGTLKQGEEIYLGEQELGKVRILRNTDGSNTKTTKPGSPAIVFGLNQPMLVGSILQNKPIIKESFLSDKTKQILNEITKFNKKAKYSFNLILKSDTAGSLEALLEMLIKIKSPQLKLNILEASVGNVEAGDIQKAHTTNALIIGFHSKLVRVASDLAKTKNVKVKLHDIIYKLQEDLVEDIKDFLPTKKKEEVVGKLEVLAIFRTEKNNMIIGGKVVSGIINRKNHLRVINKEEIIGSMVATELRQADKIVEEVKAGKECGLKLKGGIKIEPGYILEFFTITEEKDTIEF